MFKPNLKKLIRTAIEDAFNEVFHIAHEFAGTTSGDITIDQTFKLGEMKEDLHALVYNQVMQNMTPEQLAAKGEGSLVDQKFSEYLSQLDDQAAAGLLREMAFSLGEQERRTFIIKHLPELRSAAVHESHCDESGCKYGDQDCPVAAAGNRCTNCDFDMGEGYENCGASEDGTCPECGHNHEEVQWNVPVMRTGYGHTLIAVTARTEQEAIDKALDEAGGEDFSEKSSEYTAPDGAHRIG